MIVLLLFREVPPLLVKMSVKQHDNDCLLCAWSGQYYTDIDASCIDKLTNIIDSGYGVHDNAVIAEELHHCFRTLARETALEHIEGLH